MNPAAILALMSDLYAQVNALSEENAQLREAITAAESAAEQKESGLIQENIRLRNALNETILREKDSSEADEAATKDEG